MKRYHELARIMDKGETVGYFIGDTYDLADPNSFKDISTLKWIKVTPDEFKELVASGQMQLLTLEGNEIVCRLTKEELTAHVRIGVNKKYAQQMEQRYWLDDVTFSSEHIRLAEEGLALACSVSAIAKVLVAYFIPLLVYGTEKNIKHLLSQTEALKKKACVLKPGSQNNCSLLVPLVGNQPSDVLSNLGTPLLYNTVSLENSFDKAKGKVGLFTTVGSTSDTETVLHVLNQQTLDSLDRITNATPKRSIGGFVQKTNLFG